MAKKNVSQVVSGLGLGMGILEGLVAAIREAGGTDEDIHWLATPEGRATLAAMAKLAVVRKDADAFTARFVSAIKACNFVGMNDYVTPVNFPEPVFGQIGEGHILDQPPATKKDYWIGTEIDQWLAEKAKEGYEPATLADGLDFIAKNPRAHRDGPVVFWASVSAGGDVAYLRRAVDERFLDADRRVVGWIGHCRFLLRKVPAKGGQAQA